MRRYFPQRFEDIPLDPPARTKGVGARRRRDVFALQQSGLTLVELLVALVISLFLLAGLVAVFAAMNSSFSTSKRLNYLVGQQRLASTVMTNTIAGAGYWPMINVTALNNYQNIAGAFPALDVTVEGHAFDFDAGQVVAGSGGTAAGAADTTIATRMLAAPATSGVATPVLNCQGGANTSTTDFQRSVNVFWINSSKNELMCAVRANDGTTITTSKVPLLGGNVLPVPGTAYGGVASLVALYGVDTNADGSVDRYMSADTLNSAQGDKCPSTQSGLGNASTCWPYVRSVRVTLGFVSALDPDKTFLLSRNIVLANAIGLYVQSGGGIPLAPLDGNAGG